MCRRGGLSYWCPGLPGPFSVDELHGLRRVWVSRAVPSTLRLKRVILSLHTFTRLSCLINDEDLNIHRECRERMVAFHVRTTTRNLECATGPG
jgi:hypothetical protein